MITAVYFTNTDRNLLKMYPEDVVLSVQSTVTDEDVGRSWHSGSQSQLVSLNVGFSLLEQKISDISGKLWFVRRVKLEKTIKKIKEKKRNCSVYKPQKKS